MSVTFDPESIRNLGASVANKLVSATAAAEQQLAGVSIALPRRLAGEQSQINQIIRSAPTGVELLTALAEGFRERMNASADDYEATESANQAAVANIDWEL